ncbi:hypothetical protein GCM10028806_52310 [Spirosoma terrae]|uniref:Uncharacterized protein n=1 Tax=Spirosoma terrae TaxID=1968276 RepID=A0A6L9LAR8_9BACT|nr:hypothetical protein [Spirosoma terrae]NDU96587.1 hypothetical protein [Spirosoma terrae]
MRQLTPDIVDTSGKSSSQVPSVMDNDPNADEEIINQQVGEQYPKAVEQPAELAKISPDNLADSIAYAIDGSGPGITNDTPNAAAHSVVAEGDAPEDSQA